MELASVDFAAYSKAAVKRFLRTAVLIDDQIEVVNMELSEPAEEVIAPVFAATAMTAAPAEAVAAHPVASAEPIATDQEAKPRLSSEVSLKRLADAFLDRQIVCGVLNPASSDQVADIVDRAVKSAVVADILIIDWYLRPGNADIAKEVLVRVLKSDQDLNGRLRLIIVYTGALPLEDRRNELKGLLEERGFSVRLFDERVPSVAVASCRICFVEKASGATGKAVDELPDFAISEFSDQAKGLMPGFALTGIAALREATHHLLATFSSRLDPAFVGHRMLLQDPEDSQEFALNVLMLQIRGILSLPHLLGSSLEVDEIGAWFDDRYAATDAAQALKQLNVGKDALRAAIMDGGARERAFHTALFVPSDPQTPQDREIEVSSDFARLTTFVREFNGFNPLPAGWRPVLTLGLVLRMAQESGIRYFLSLQPLCDTVRIKEARFFPFVELKVKDQYNSDFWLVVCDGVNRLHLGIDGKAGSRYYDKFNPSNESGMVRATVEKAAATGNEAFLFKSVDGIIYEWVGDIDRSKAQKASNDLSAALARIGLDEYEWLRRGARAR